MRELGPFVRLSMPAYEYCGGRDTETLQIGISEQLCDFPFQHVEKGSSLRLANYPDVIYFMDRYNLTYSTIMSLLVNASASDHDYWRVACDFLLSDPVHLDAWTTDRQPDNPPVLLAFIALSGVIAYFYIWQYIVEVTRRLMRLPKLLPEALRGQAGEDDADDGDDEADPGSPDSQVEGEGESMEAKPVTVTLASRVVQCTEEDGAVAVPVLRVDGNERAVELHIETRDYTAYHGVDYGDMSLFHIDEGTNTSVGRNAHVASAMSEMKTAKNSAGGRQVTTLRLDPGVSNALLKVPIFPTPGYDSTKFFSIRLSCKSDDCLVHIKESIVRVLNVGQFPNGRTFSAKLDRRGERLSIVYHFLIEAHRGGYYVSIKHQFAQLALALIAGYGQPVWKAMMIDSFTEKKRFDVSIYAALMLATAYFLGQKLEMWFSDGWNVRKRLQRNLTRKFLTLSDHDVELCAAKVEMETKTAISAKAAALANECYGGFHSVLASVWKILISLYYIFNAASSSLLPMYAIIIPLLTIMFGLIGYRRNASAWTYSQRSFAADVKLEGMLSFTMRARRLIRESYREGRATRRMQTAISESLNAGYALWEHNLHTSWWCKGILVVVVCFLWAFAPFIARDLMTPGQFVVLLDMLNFLAGSWLSLVMSILDVYTSGSTINEVAQCARLRRLAHFSPPHILDSSGLNGLKACAVRACVCACCIGAGCSIGGLQRRRRCASWVKRRRLVAWRPVPLRRSPAYRRLRRVSRSINSRSSWQS